MDSLPTFPTDAPESICLAVMVTVDDEEMSMLMSRLSTYTARKATRRSLGLNLVLAGLANAFRKITEKQVQGNIADLYTLFTIARTRGWTSLLVFDALSLLQLKAQTKPNQDTELQLVLLTEPPVSIGARAPMSVLARRVNLPQGFQLANPLSNTSLDPPPNDFIIDKCTTHMVPAKEYYKRGFLVYSPEAPLLPEGFEDAHDAKWDDNSKIEPTVHECLDAKNVPAELQLIIIALVRDRPLDELSTAPANILATKDSFHGRPPWVTLALPWEDQCFERDLEMQIQATRADYEKEFGPPDSRYKNMPIHPYIPLDASHVSRWKSHKPATRRDFWRLFQLFVAEYERCRERSEKCWKVDGVTVEWVTDPRTTHDRRAMGIVIPEMLARDTHMGIAKNYGVGKPVYVEWGWFCGLEELTRVAEVEALGRTYDGNWDDAVGCYELLCDPDGGFYADE